MTLTIDGNNIGAFTKSLMKSSDFEKAKLEALKTTKFTGKHDLQLYWDFLIEDISAQKDLTAYYDGEYYKIDVYSESFTLDEALEKAQILIDEHGAENFSESREFEVVFFMTDIEIDGELFNKYETTLFYEHEDQVVPETYVFAGGRRLA